MRRKAYICSIVLLTTLCLSFSGCATIPKGFLKLSEDNLERRQLQIRQYDTQDEVQIMQAVEFETVIKNNAITTFKQTS